MNTATVLAGLSPVKARQQETWASGDLTVILSRVVLVSELLAEAADLRAGSRVLDVACGNGNATLAAARRGAHVLGVDYVPELLEGGRGRAVAERLDVEFRLGDAEDLPVPDASFDAVLSVFGAMLAPDHHRTADEIARVTRRGGTVGLASWTPDGFVGEMFAVIAQYVPGPPGIESPPLVRADPQGIRGARRRRPRRAGRRPGRPRPPLGPERRRQHRHPRHLPGEHPHPPLTGDRSQDRCGPPWSGTTRSHQGLSPLAAGAGPAFTMWRFSGRGRGAGGPGAGGPGGCGWPGRGAGRATRTSARSGRCGRRRGRRGPAGRSRPRRSGRRSAARPGRRRSSGAGSWCPPR